MMNMANKFNIIVVAMPFPFTGGGGYRALLSIKEYKKRGINPFLVLPWGFQFLDREKRKEGFHLLSREGINVYGKSTLPKIIPSNFPTKRTLAQLLASWKFPMKIIINKNITYRSNCTVSFHEGIDAIATCLEIGKRFSLKRIALLQLPPFYGDANRIKNIRSVNYLWSKIVSHNPLLRETWFFLQKNIEQKVSRSVKSMLNSFDLIIAVSKSIPIEMGKEWLNKIITMDPGIALSQDDLQVISKMSKKGHEKEKIVVFGGRASPEKGIIDGLIAWKFILKEVGQDYKLVITGNIEPNILAKLKELCYDLEIEDNVLFTGFISREERLSIVARAKMMLYPSHTDAFPYAVLEALYLNTPVVAYDIPALRIYYGNLEGVSLVRESDVDDLVQRSVETINSKHVYVEKPRFMKSWDEIMDEETKLIKEILFRE